MARWRRGQQQGAARIATRCLIQRYRQDPRFTDLAAATQRGYDYHLRTIEAWSERAGHPPITTIERKHVKLFARSLAGTPGKAQQVICVLRTLFAFAIDGAQVSWPRTTRPTCGSEVIRRAIKCGRTSR